jgi:hypothetical protein
MLPQALGNFGLVSSCHKSGGFAQPDRICEQFRAFGAKRESFERHK